MNKVNGHKQNELPKGWKLLKLFEIGKIVSGGTPSTKEPQYWNDEIKWITPADLSGYSNKHIAQGRKSISKKGLENSSAKLLPKGSVLFSSRAPIGYVAIAANDLCTNQGFKNIIPNSEINNEYLYYYLKASKDLAEKHASGTTFKEISASKFSELPIPVPPIQVQQQIVSKIEELFSELDKSIAQLKTTQQQLKVYRQSVLKWAFEGKLTHEWRNQQSSLVSTKELKQKIKNEQQKHFEVAGKKLKPVSPIGNEEGLTELPEGWIWFRLGDVVWSVKDGPHYSPKYQEKGIPFISGGNIRPEGIDFSKAKCISQELHNELSLRCKPEVNDVLYTKGGTTGIARVNTYPIDFNVWVHVAVLKPIKSLLPFYLQHVLNSNHCYKQSQKYTHGVGNQDLGLTRMVLITLPICSIEEQQQVIQEIETRLSVADKLEETITNSLQQAEGLRQGILKKAFEGRLLK